MAEQKARDFFIALLQIGVLVFILSGATATAALYSFEDKHGNVHITDTPPDDTYHLLLTTFKTPRTFKKFVGTGYHHLDMIQQIARDKGLPWNLLMAIIKTESNFDPRAVSSRGAKGLMQLMPGVCKDYDVKDPFDVKQNIQAGAGYFRWLFDRFKDVKLAMAAYNAGPGRVDQYNGVPPFKETRQYIQKVLWYYAFYERKQPLLTLPEVSRFFGQGIQALVRGDLALAATRFSTVVNRFPDSPEANYNLALISGQIGHPDRAIALYQKALAISPYFKEAHYNLAILYEQKGMVTRAIDTWKGYLEAETRPEEMRKAMGYIRELGMVGE
jgi:tetratricopeptide (TPR) repeat protein